VSWLAGVVVVGFCVVTGVAKDGTDVVWGLPVGYGPLPGGVVGLGGEAVITRKPTRWVAAFG